MDKACLKKGIIIFLMFVLLTSGFNLIQGAKVKENSIDLIDQNNRYCTGCNCAEPIMLFEGFYIAQSFAPSQNKLSKILLLVKKTGSPPTMNLTLNIRETLNGANLLSMDEEITGTEMVFEFEEITVIPGNQYYMVINIDDNSTPANGYGLYKTIYDSYNKGRFWNRVDQAEWAEITKTDLLFVTYWEDYCPDTPIIDGPSVGKAQERYNYKISTDDPEGDEVKYQIDWGDGIISNWFGPYKSGEEVEIEHQWAYEDDYTIQVKARDVYGAESGWTSLEISMSKNKVYFNPFLYFLENHPMLRHILENLFELN